MRHPFNREMRRHVRATYIQRRRRIMKTWNYNFLHWLDDNQWGRYSKWNLNCNSKLCHHGKYEYRQRRANIKRDVIAFELDSWKEDDMKLRH